MIVFWNISFGTYGEELSFSYATGEKPSILIKIFTSIFQGFSQEVQLPNLKNGFLNGIQKWRYFVKNTCY